MIKKNEPNKLDLLMKFKEHVSLMGKKFEKRKRKKKRTTILRFEDVYTSQLATTAVGMYLTGLSSNSCCACEHTIFTTCHEDQSFVT